METEPMQPETASSVASADNVTQPTEGAASTLAVRRRAGFWTYFVRLREKGKAVCQVPKLCGGSAICGATYVLQLRVVPIIWPSI